MIDVRILMMCNKWPSVSSQGVKKKKEAAHYYSPKRLRLIKKHYHCLEAMSKHSNQTTGPVYGREIKHLTHRYDCFPNRVI